MCRCLFEAEISKKVKLLIWALFVFVAWFFVSIPAVKVTRPDSSGTNPVSSHQSVCLGVLHAAWKRPQVGLISGNRTGLIKGFGWPYDSVRCLWLVWQLRFVVDHRVESVGVGLFTMSLARRKVHEPLLHSCSLHNLSAVARVRANVENNGFRAEEVGIQVFCFCTICLEVLSGPGRVKKEKLE